MADRSRSDFHKRSRAGAHINRAQVQVGVCMCTAHAQTLTLAIPISWVESWECGMGTVPLLSVCVVGFDLCFDVPRKLAEDNFDGMCPVSSQRPDQVSIWSESSHLKRKLVLTLLSESVFEDHCQKFRWRGDISSDRGHFYSYLLCVGKFPWQYVAPWDQFREVRPIHTVFVRGKVREGESGKGEGVVSCWDLEREACTKAAAAIYWTYYKRWMQQLISELSWNCGFIAFLDAVCKFALC